MSSTESNEQGLVDVLLSLHAITAKFQENQTKMAESMDRLTETMVKFQQQLDIITTAIENLTNDG